VAKEEKTLTFKGIDDFKINNVTGSIRIEGWDKNDVQVTYTKKAANQELLDRLKVEPENDGSRLLIDTDYPRRCKRCSIKFVVKVPKRLKRIEAKTVTGSLTIDGIDFVKRVYGKSVTGKIDANISCENVTLGTVTGGISLDIEKIEGDGDIDVSVITGAIKIYLPDSFAGDVKLGTVTGRVSSDFPITIRGTIGRKRIRGTIGDGSMSLDASAVTGSVRILKH